MHSDSTSESFILIPLTRGMYARVNAEDAAIIQGLSWHTYSGPTGIWYAASKTKNRKTIRMHRMIVGAKPGEVVDHADSDGLNNTRTNLRVTNQSNNSANRRISSSNRSGFKGVSFDKTTGKWRATIKKNGLKLHLGRYHDIEQAARAYDVKARELFGQFAQLNFPDDHDAA